IPTATEVAPVVPSSRLRTTRRWLAVRFPGPVQAPARVALEVERHEPVAGRLQGADDSVAFRHKARDLRGLDLDARNVAVMADPHLPEPEGFDRGFGRLDLAQSFDSHLGPMWDSRREAGERRLVPIGQAEAARGGADLRLAHSRFEQRKADATAHG